MKVFFPRDTLGSCYFLRTEITLQGATYQITFTDTDQLPPPFRVDNLSEVKQRWAKLSRSKGSDQFQTCSLTLGSGCIPGG